MTIPAPHLLALTASLCLCLQARGQQPDSSREASVGRVLLVDQEHPQAHDANDGAPTSPFKTIGAAAAVVRAGDTVLVKAGVYREHVQLTNSGTSGRRITLKAMPGERVVISGADQITGWRPASPEELRGNPNFENIYCLELPWAPVRLFAEGRPDGLHVSRYPKGSETRPHRDSIVIEAGDHTRVVDSKHFTQEAGFWEGGTLGVWRAANDSVSLGTIVTYRPDRHELVVDKRRAQQPVVGKDRYFVYNLVSLITQPGEYAIDSSRKPHRLYLWPLSPGHPDNHNIEGTRRRSAVTGSGVSHVTIEGFEVARTYGNGIGFARGAHNAIVSCIAYYCQNARGMRAAFGLSLGGQTHSVISNSISALNSYGIGLSRSTNCVVEENFSGRHMVDAIVVSWHARNIRVAHNYVFDTWSTGHPDGFQTYRDVQGLVLDGNLFLSVGQGWQCAETQDSFVTNNIWAGIHWPNSISCSLRPPTVGDPNLRNIFVNNTFFGGSVSTGGESRFLNNIAIPPTFGGTAGGPTLESDFNLLWSWQRHVFTWIERATGRNRRGTFREWQRHSTKNQHSRFADPRFRNAPRIVRHLADAQPRLDERRVFLRQRLTTGTKRGDWAEFDCDGIRRRITAVASDHIVVDSLPDRPFRGGLSFVWIWDGNAPPQLDLRLGRTSPGKNLASHGGDVGSTIDIASFQRGDFNGDGKRHLPDLPPELHNISSLLKPLE